MKYTNNL